MTDEKPRRRWVIACLLVVVAIGYWLSYSLNLGEPTAQDVLFELDELQEFGHSTMLEANKLAIQLGLLLFAAWGALLMADNPIIRLRHLQDVILMVISLAAATLAVHAGYVQYDKIVEMLAAGYLDLDSPLILAPRDLQVTCLLVSLSTLGIGAVLAGQRNTEELRNSKPPTNDEAIGNNEP